MQVRANQINTFRWLHGVHQAEGALPVKTELEQIIPQDLAGTDTFRRGDRVYYSTPDSPVQVTVNHYIKELPAILFHDQLEIMKLYDAVPGSSTSLSGRTAQLLRLTAKDSGRYDYWLWLDDKTGFPLRIDTMSEQQNALERWLVTHMQIVGQMPDSLSALLQTDLPPAAESGQVTAAANKSHSLSWLPQGYIEVVQPAMSTSLDANLLSYWLLSDGLHQVSVFVQNSQRLPAQAYRDGATTIYVQSDNQLEVTVIGPVSIDIARQLAAAVH